MLDAQDVEAAERIEVALSLSQRLQEEGLATSKGSGRVSCTCIWKDLFVNTFYALLQHCHRQRIRKNLFYLS